MKIYNRIRFDIESWKILEEDSFDYSGPLAYCDGTSSSSVSSSSVSSSSSSSSCSSGVYSGCCYIDGDDDFNGINGQRIYYQKWTQNDHLSNWGPILIENNEARAIVAASPADYLAGANSRWSLSGDFDVQIDYNIASADEINVWYFQLEIRRRDIVSSDYFRVQRAYNSTYGGHTYDCIKRNSGGTSTTRVITTDNSGKFRITRVGSTLNGYYDDGGWVLIRSDTWENVDAYIRLIVQSAISYPSLTVDYNNFVINSVDTFLCPSSLSSSSSSSSTSLSTSSSSSSTSSSSSLSSSSSSSSSFSGSSSSSSSSSSSTSSSSSSVSSSSSSSAYPNKTRTWGKRPVDDYQDCEDTYLDADSPIHEYNSAQFLKIRDEGLYGSVHTLMRFDFAEDLMAFISDSNEIASAIIYLYNYSSTIVDDPVQLRQVYKEWIVSLTSPTWVDFKPGHTLADEWQIKGGTGAIDSHAMQFVDSTAAGWQAFDITDYAKTEFDAIAVLNLMLLFSPIDGYKYHKNEWWSSEYTVNTALRPYLEIAFYDVNSSSSSVSSSSSSSSSSLSSSSLSSSSRSLSSSSSSSSTSAGGGGYNYFNNTYWEPISGIGATWSIDRWIPNALANTVWITPIGGWEAGFIPLIIDITVDDISGGSDTYAFGLYRLTTDVGVTGIALNSGDTYSFDVSSGAGDIVALRVDGTVNFSITNIVLYT